MGTKPFLLLGLVVAALVLPFAHAAVTIFNPAGLVVDRTMTERERERLGDSEPHPSAGESAILSGGWRGGGRDCAERGCACRDA